MGDENGSKQCKSAIMSYTFISKKKKKDIKHLQNVSASQIKHPQQSINNLDHDHKIQDCCDTGIPIAVEEKK